MRAPRIDLTAAAWRTSSYSNTDGGACVEVADNIPGTLPVRDSKNPHGPALTFRSGSWSAFVNAVTHGSL
jgi:hypothetical protein